MLSLYKKEVSFSCYLITQMGVILFILFQCMRIFFYPLLVLGHTSIYTSEPDKFDIFQMWGFLWMWIVFQPLLMIVDILAIPYLLLLDYYNSKNTTNKRIYPAKWLIMPSKWLYQFIKTWILRPWILSPKEMEVYELVAHNIAHELTRSFWYPVHELACTTYCYPRWKYEPQF
jgi:hypothetical protein